MSMTNLFERNELNTTTGTRGLPGTAELTNIATNTANRILRAMEADIEHYGDKIKASSADSKVLEEILDDFKPLCDIEEDHILRHLSDETVESMLKSQQSKRSRTKSKTMTLDNYTTLLTAAIAEDILREIYNKPKSAVGYSRNGGAVDFTGAQLEMLAEDQEALRREIRNIQSKKSIMKSKADFTESDPRWLALLKAEQQLKDLRVGSRGMSVIEVDTTKDALVEMLVEVDIQHLKLTEARELLESIKEIINLGPITDEVAESNDEQ